MTDSGGDGRRRRLDPDLRADLRLVAALSLISVAAGALLMKVTGVAGGDDPAHTYKTELVRAGKSIFWDDRWYGGVYGPIHYGPIYYWFAAFVPEDLINLVSAASLPVLFLLYLRASRRGRGRLAGLALAGVMGVYLTYGQEPFLLAMAVTMVGMAVLAAGRPVLGALPIGVGLFINPLALSIAGPLLLADFIARPDVRRRYLVCAAALTPFLALDAALTALFWQPSWYFDQVSVIRAVLLFCAAGFLLSWSSKADTARPWRVFFVVYALVCLVTFALPAMAFGNNVARTFQLLGLPLLLAIEGVRLPRWVSVPAIVIVGLAQLAGPVNNYLHPAWFEASRESFWSPPLAVLDRLNDSQHRLHVVATKKHAEAYFVPRAGYAITRGWFRQDDAVHNELFTRDFGQAEYVAWLRRMGVEYVLLPHVALDPTSVREPTILASSPAFDVVADEPDWTLYRLVGTQPLVRSLSGPGAAGGGVARVDAFDTSLVSLSLPAPGSYEVKVSWSPYWSVVEGEATLACSDEDFVLVKAAAAGPLVLELTVTPGTIADRVRSIL